MRGGLSEAISRTGRCEELQLPNFVEGLNDAEMLGDVVERAHQGGWLWPTRSLPRRHANCPTSASGLRPISMNAFQAFGQKVFADGALPGKTKQLIAVAVAHVTQCPYCIKGHTKAALRAGASREELMESIWVAAEMRAGGAYAHSILAIEDMERVERKTD
jgi:AhpD family alkylhydroperoxidase